MDDPADPQSLLADLGDRAEDVSFLIRDRAGQFTEYFDAVLANTGIQALCDARACQQADARWPVKVRFTLLFGVRPIPPIQGSTCAN
jgi:hypothetical protein